MTTSIRVLASALAFGWAVCAFGQTQQLTLENALRLAKERNGTVRSAYLAAESARSRSLQSLAAFFPTITPQYRYDSDRRQVANNQFQQTEGGSSGISASWLALDMGQREFGYRASLRTEAAAKASALQTLRDILFSVHQQYYDALRTDELFRVADLQVQRTQTIFDQTTARAENGDAPKKDILQAKADALNAKVEQLTAKNNRTTAIAVLKATIGYDQGASIPELVKPAAPTNVTPPPPLADEIRNGLANRADLIAERDRVDALRFDESRAARDAGLALTVSASFNKDFSPDHFQNRAFTLIASYPLFDGGISRENVRQARLAVQSERASLLQQERTAQSQIESVYAQVTQDLERVTAAQLALDAAQLNYNAEVDSQKAGAQGTSVVTVLTAQVSLVTAESNYIQAIYDYYIAEAQLKLVTGEPVPGES